MTKQLEIDYCTAIVLWLNFCYAFLGWQCTFKKKKKDNRNSTIGEQLVAGTFNFGELAQTERSLFKMHGGIKDFKDVIHA